MTRLRIVAVAAAVMIALGAWRVPLEAGGCPDGARAAKSPAPGGSGGPDWFYGGVDWVRGSGDRSEAPERPKDANRCGPGRYEAPKDAGAEGRPRDCEDVRARFY